MDASRRTDRAPFDPLFVRIEYAEQADLEVVNKGRLLPLTRHKIASAMCITFITFNSAAPIYGSTKNTDACPARAGVMRSQNGHDFVRISILPPDAAINLKSRTAPQAKSANPLYDHRDREYDVAVAKLYERFGLFGINRRDTPLPPTSAQLVAEGEEDLLRGDKFFAARKFIAATESLLAFGPVERGKELAKRAVTLAQGLPSRQRLTLSNQLIQVANLLDYGGSSDRVQQQELLLELALSEQRALNKPDDNDTIAILQMLSRSYQNERRYVDRAAVEHRIEVVNSEISLAHQRELQKSIAELNRASINNTGLAEIEQTVDALLALQRAAAADKEMRLLNKLNELLSLECQKEKPGSDVDTYVNLCKRILNTYEPVGSSDPNSPFDNLASSAVINLDATCSSWGDKIPDGESLRKASYLLRVKISGFDYTTLQSCERLVYYLSSHGKAWEGSVLARDLLAMTAGYKSLDGQRAQLLTALNDAERKLGVTLTALPSTSTQTSITQSIVPSTIANISPHDQSIIEADKQMEAKLLEESRGVWTYITTRDYAGGRNRLRYLASLYVEAPGHKENSINIWPLAEFVLTDKYTEEIEQLGLRVLNTAYKKAALGDAPNWLSQATARMTDLYWTNHNPAATIVLLRSWEAILAASKKVHPEDRVDLLKQISRVQHMNAQYGEETKTGHALETLIAGVNGPLSPEFCEQLLSNSIAQAQLSNFDEARKTLQRAIVIEENAERHSARDPE